MINSLCQKAGITINGSQPWDIQVRDDRFYKDLIQGGSLALGEMYMYRWWTVEKLDQFFEHVFSAGLQQSFKSSWALRRLQLLSKLFNRQSTRRAFTVAKQHYDIDNSLYEKMLDANMVYSCGYWQGSTDLDQAQLNKLDLICRKLNLKPGMKMLDIGCGWGSLIHYACTHYGVSALGITVSSEQAKLARYRCRNLPIKIKVMDFRELDKEQFDAIASVGMIEHVGYKNYSRFMNIVAERLKPEGLFLLHTIGSNESESHTDPWIEKYIFPNSMIPSLSQLTQASENVLFVEDLHSFGQDYDKTLMAWQQNFKNAWQSLKGKYDDVFYRMWNYYLLMSAAGFRTRYLRVWQLVMTGIEFKGSVKTIR